MGTTQFTGGQIKDGTITADDIDGNDAADIKTKLGIGAAGTATSVRETITQSTHGFTNPPKALYYNGSAYALAKADAASTSTVRGVIESIPDADTFVLVFAGKITVTGGFTVGDNFLSAATAGVLTTTEPSTTGQISKPVLNADSADVAYVQIQRGLPIP